MSNKKVYSTPKCDIAKKHKKITISGVLCLGIQRNKNFSSPKIKI